MPNWLLIPELFFLIADRETPGETNAAMDRVQDIQVTGYTKVNWAPSTPLWEVEILRRMEL